MILKKIHDVHFYVDKRRSKYYQFFTGQTWGEKLNYDLCINTSGANIEDLVKVIAKLVK